jgi:hypothetical protein
MAKHCWNVACPTVQETGAVAGSVLVGVASNNHFLRLRVCEAQPKGNGSALIGPFRILAAGIGRHAGALEPLLGRQTNAAEVMRLCRRDEEDGACVVQTNLLAVD